MKEKGEGVAEDKMVGYHHWLSGHEFEQTLGDSEGQGSLVYCSPWGHKELDQLSEWTTTTAALLFAFEFIWWTEFKNYYQQKYFLVIGRVDGNRF